MNVVTECVNVTKRKVEIVSIEEVFDSGSVFVSIAPRSTYSVTTAPSLALYASILSLSTTTFSFTGVMRLIEEERQNETYTHPFNDYASLGT